MSEMTTVAVPLGRVGVRRPGITSVALTWQHRLQGRRNLRNIRSPVRVECHHPQAEFAQCVIHIFQWNSGKLRCFTPRRSLVVRIWHAQHTHLKKGCPQGVDICPGHVRYVRVVLRRCVAMGTAGARFANFHPNCAAKIEQPNAAILPYCHIFRLDVAVQQTTAMHLFHDGTQLCHRRSGELRADGSVVFRKPRQWLPIDVVHHEVSPATVLASAVYRRNSMNSLQLLRILQIFGQLPGKALKVGRAMESTTSLSLDRHDLAVAPIARLKHFAEITAAYPTHDVVSPVDSGARFDHNNSRPKYESEDQYGTVATY